MIKQSTALRILLYLLMFIIGLFAAFFVVFAPLFGASSLTLEYFVVPLAVSFLIYLFLGFLFCFVNPTRPWLPALLLSTPAIMFLIYALFVSVDFVLFVYFITTLGAATFGAYLSAFLQSRKKDKESLDL